MKSTTKQTVDTFGNVKPKTKAAYLQSLNESEKAENFKIIDNMNKRVNFLRNPRTIAKTKLITLDKAGGVFLKTKDQL